MVKKRVGHPDKFQITIKSKKIEILLDKVLFFRVIDKLHGRFWGVMSIQIMLYGMTICFLIRPDLFRASAAFSNFGEDVRTAPYFAGTMFFSSYALWRWRNHLTRTLQQSQPITTLITLTIVGFYLIALMPISWKPWPFRIHNLGVMIAGLSMIATVIVDGLLTKAKDEHIAPVWRFLRLLSVLLLIDGLVFTVASSTTVGIYHVALLGEFSIMIGYAVWVFVKTFQKEGGDSRLAKLIRKLVVIK
jgi:hypothetical protein